MYIGLKNIRQLFPDLNYRIRETAQTCCLTGWIKLEDTTVSYTTHLLYVCVYKEELKKLRFLPHMHILCVAGEQENLERLSDFFPPSVNILWLQEENPSLIYAGLAAYFGTQGGIGLFADTLLETLFSEGGIQAMINHAYHAFGNPIFVFDAGFHLIAANWEEAQRTDSGRKVVENRGFSEREFKMVNSRGHIHEKVQKSDVPILAFNPDLGYNQLLCAIDTEKDLGHIVVSAINRPIEPIDSQLLLILKKCIDQQLKKDAFIRNAKGFHYEYFLKDLLDGKIATGTSFLDRLDYVCREFAGNIYCLVLETARSPGTLNTFHIRGLFENCFPSSKTLMYNGEIIVIISMPENQTLPEKHLDRAIGICKKNDLYAGLSNCFQNIIEIPQYYKQALRAIELGICTVNGPNLFSYEHYYLEHVKNIFLQKESSKTFCHPQMKFLLDYDSKHGSELAYTLYMYLINERNIAAASFAMHMHRNTLVYRIKKIKALINSDFESCRERQYLILSYEMNREPPS